MQFPGSRRAPDRAAALAQYRRRADFYDYELEPFEPIRGEAIGCLELRPGDTVLDVGCGTGLSFELLHRYVGPHGRIVGIEQCPEMMAKAQARVRENGWENVELVCAPAEAAQAEVLADAALFHFTHDVLRESAAIGNVLAHLKRGARVVASGLQWAPPWAWPANAFVLLAAMYSATSLEGLGHPWDKLARRLTDVEVRSMMGCIYVARGVYSPDLH
jgi:SAM-dependent methyltransferase